MTFVTLDDNHTQDTWPNNLGHVTSETVGLFKDEKGAPLYYLTTAVFVHIIHGSLDPSCGSARFVTDPLQHPQQVR